MSALILTRPAAQIPSWAQALQAAGVPPQDLRYLPMIEIAGADSVHDQQALLSCLQSTEGLQDLQGLKAIMFVSANAVQWFWSPNSPSAEKNTAVNAIKFIVNSGRMRCWATGPGTVQALLAAGVERGQIDAPDAQAGQFDSEALWQQVQPQIRPGAQVLIVRGRDVGSPDSSRDWLAQQITASGGQARSVVVYERRAPRLSDAQLAQCQQWLRDGSWWVWSSSQALRHLPLSLDVSQARSVCTHERIAQAALARGFGQVRISPPLPQAVLVSIKSSV